MQRQARGPAAAVLLALVLLVSHSAVGAVRTRSMAFQEARARRAANYIGPEDDKATVHRKLLQLGPTPSAQIFLDGILETATLDAACVAAQAATDPPVCGGTLTVMGGTVVTVPNNMVVMFPASALTWQEMFDPANGAPSTTSTGLALNDPVKSGAGTYLVSVAANRVNSKNQIIAALIDITQDPVSTGSGYVNKIDYGTGEMTIETNGGIGTKVRLNDPAGRYGMVQDSTKTSMDPRFGVDIDNPTVRAATAYPMCIPRKDPAAATPTDPEDPLCPTTNHRPTTGASATTFTMGVVGVSNPDPTKMVPIVVGDYVNFAGVMTTGGFIAAYEVVANVAIFTQPGKDPAYTAFETALIGTGGLNTLGAGEAAIRSRFEGVSTDPTRPVQVWGLDFDPATGDFAQRPYGEVMPDPGPPLGAQPGRWRFRPPCTYAPVGGPTLGLQAGVDVYQGNKGCTAPPAGIYTPPPREVMSNVKGCVPMPPTAAVPANNATKPPTAAIPAFPGVANGIASGGCSYRNPAIEYIWPESFPGTPVAESNFDALAFLVSGGYTSAPGTLVGGLEPWPSNVLPKASCAAPVIDLAASFTAIEGGSVVLKATVTGPNNPSVTWAPVAPGQSQSPDATSLNPTFGPVFSDPTTPGATQFKLTATNSCARTATATTTVKLSADTGATAAATPAVLQIPAAARTFNSGTTKNSITATLLSGTGTFTWSMPDPKLGFTLTGQAPATASNTSTFTFGVPTNPATPTSVAPKVYPATVKATVGTVDSPLVPFDIIVLPQPDTTQLQTVAFRCDKHRLTLTASSSVANPNLDLFLANYTTNSGSTFDPTSISTSANKFANGGGGAYTMTIEPVPLPSTNTATASLQVYSSIGGKSAKVVVSTAQIKNGVCSI